jgi:hypothetical protein
MRKQEVHLYAQDTPRTTRLVEALKRAGIVVAISVCPNREKPLAVCENQQRAEGFREIRQILLGQS